MPLISNLIYFVALLTENSSMGKLPMYTLLYKIMANISTGTKHQDIYTAALSELEKILSPSFLASMFISIILLYIPDYYTSSYFYCNVTFS